MIIKIDKRRSFKYSLRSLRELEKALGEPLFTVFSDEKKMTSIDVMVKFIWAGMLEDEELTIEEVEKIVPLPELTRIMTEAGDLLGQAMSGDPSQKKMAVSKAS